MSYAMSMSTVIKVDASIPVNDYLYEITTVKIHGWTGRVKFDYNELQIVQCLNFNEKQLQMLLDNNVDVAAIKYVDHRDRPRYLGLTEVENGKWDHCIGIDQYKEAIAKFRKLAVFL